jgi:hypothetical protein
MWKGVIDINNLVNGDLLKLTNVVEKTGDTYKIGVKEEDKEEFVQKAIKSINKKGYVYIVKDKVMYVMFKNHMFKFSKGYPELETARNYGKTQGISEEKMPFEHLIDNPFDI